MAEQTEQEIYDAVCADCIANADTMPRSDYGADITHRLLAKLIKSVDDLVVVLTP